MDLDTAKISHEKSKYFRRIYGRFCGICQMIRRIFRGFCDFWGRFCVFASNIFAESMLILSNTYRIC
ncbi:hypothetical protein [Helicobacter sp. 23-1045]